MITSIGVCYVEFIGLDSKGFFRNVGAGKIGVPRIEWKEKLVGKQVEGRVIWVPGNTGVPVYVAWGSDCVCWVYTWGPSLFWLD